MPSAPSLVSIEARLRAEVTRENSTARALTAAAETAPAR